MIPSTLYAQLNALGITKTEADTQYKLLLNGATYCALSEPATLGNGILPISAQETKRLAQFYTNSTNANLTIQKFVPASGAATRMFKDLVEFDTFGKLTSSIQQLINGLDKLAFLNLIPSNLAKNEAVKYLISTLNYNKIPKGLIPFHIYDGTPKTAFEEHWVEAALYAINNEQANVHFTISPQHQQAFTQLEKKLKPTFEIKNNTQLNISYSNQKPSTDTLCINATNNIVLNADGSPLLRPGGHGALIQNLQALEADIIFIKNIDNVVHQSHIETTVIYKQALAGKLIELKNTIFKQLKTIDSNNYLLSDLESLGKEVCLVRPDSYANWNKNTKVAFWKAKLNRPIRVCGMVKNEGEPGGGPFWVKGKDGVSLQVVESAQIDTTDKVQQSILQQSTHFNPVDLVCLVTDYKGNRFNLTHYIDESSAFITSKTVNGQELKVLERPGLWNGAMADWITLFVEVPIETFNPVKTVNDLLKLAHLS